MNREAFALTASSPSARRWWMGASALFCIGVQLPGSLLLSAAALALWLLQLLLFDRASLRRLWMPRFWIATLIFAVASGLFLGPRAAKGLWSIVSQEGLAAGLLMVLRGVFIFGLATWASRALGGEDLQKLARRLGLPRLGASISVALQLLPDLTEHLRASIRERPARADRGVRGRLGRLYRPAVQVMVQTARLAESIVGEVKVPRDGPRPILDHAPGRILAAVVGPPGSGKTTLIQELARSLRERGLSVGGICQVAVHEAGERAGYLLRDEATGEERPFARRRTRSAPGELGFGFDLEAWSWAQERIRRARLDVDVCVVDELGRLEAKGEGHLPALAERLKSERAGVCLLGVRADCASAVQDRLGPFHLTLSLEQGASAVEPFLRQMASACSESHERDQQGGRK